MPRDDLDALEDIVLGERVYPFFQPIINLRRRVLYGYEGLIRGPSDSPLHSPVRLFAAAALHGRLLELDYLARRVLIEQFARLQLRTRLFININPEVLMSPRYAAGLTRGYLRRCGMVPEQVVIEITETQPVENYSLIQTAVEHYREEGFSIAIDDLGAGYSGLKLWSEVRPDFVKIDRHFIAGIASDRVKHQFVRSILEISQSLGCQVIKEGVETLAEYSAVRKLGVGFAQGYYFSRPEASPPLEASPAWFRSPGTRRRPPAGAHSASQLLRSMPTVHSDDTMDAAAEVFLHNPSAPSICVLSQDEPVGILQRAASMNLYAHRFGRELYGRRRVRRFTDTGYLTFDVSTPLEVVSKRITGTPDTYVDEFVLVDQGRFAGRGTLLDLLQHITQQQIEIARHANPLTALPGNVPLMRHLEQLLRAGRAFVMAYCDLDHFKPFNDTYGYAHGDEVIKLLAETLQTHTVGGDFVGHIGGDDFMVFFQREDWELCCRNVLAAFSDGVRNHYPVEDRRRGFVVARDRDDRERQHPLVTLSIGVLEVPLPQGHHIDYVIEQITQVKRRAKGIAGNSVIRHQLEAAPDASPAPLTAEVSTCAAA